jgi:hypothetical protein
MTGKMRAVREGQRILRMDSGRVSEVYDKLWVGFRERLELGVWAYPKMSEIEGLALFTFGCNG